MRKVTRREQEGCLLHEVQTTSNMAEEQFDTAIIGQMTHLTREVRISYVWSITMQGRCSSTPILTPNLRVDGRNMPFRKSRKRATPTKSLNRNFSLGMRAFAPTRNDQKKTIQATQLGLEVCHLYHTTPVGT